IIIGLKAQGVEAPEVRGPEVMVAHFGGATKQAAVEIAFALRAQGIGTRLAFARERRSMKSQMREADRAGVAYTIIIGDAELAEQAATIRSMVSGDQELVAMTDVGAWIANQKDGLAET
ncbi:MAG: His/Gly/Thr/Pro-type tRNA ligase C-terminal domain-containing protein, partial [Candidatus Promineifilaceae bacterium]